jgi:hypothetical protein
VEFFCDQKDVSFDLPPNSSAERENAILTHIAQGDFEIAWATITAEYDGHAAEFYVFADALKIGGVRVNVTAETAQKAADQLDCMLLTPRLADLIFEQREVTLPPFPRGNTNGMTTTSAMVEHSAKIDAALAAQSNPGGLICTVGKHWVVDNGLLGGRMIKGFPVAMNYGWHFVGQSFGGSGFEITASRLQNADGRYYRLIQGKGTRHNTMEVDYSQTLTLVSLACKVDDVEMRLDEVLKDPKLAALANFGGVLQVLRQPGV